MKVILIILIYILITLIVTKTYFKQYDYFTTKYGYRCATCPPNSTSPIGSMSQTYCKCDVGFTGPDGSVCTPCPTGKFKDSIGDGSCQDCEEDTYQDVTGSQTCEPCDASDCVAGQYLHGCGGGNAGSCEPCDASVCTDEQYLYGCSGTNAGSCEPCDVSVCEVDQYLDGCSGTNAGSCEPCDASVCTDDQYLYGCGFNHYGELGFNSNSVARGRQYYEDEDTSELYSYHIVPVSVPTIRTEFTITQIVCGFNHSLFLTTEGRVYSCGLNNKGQLGLNSTVSQKKTPTLIETYAYNGGSLNYNRIRITQIASGVLHSLFLNSDGHVYSCGYNFYGQLGIGTSRSGSDKNTPTLIETYAYNGGSLGYRMIAITQIACGAYNSLFLTSEGYVFSCGYNYFGQLGIGTRGWDSDINTPKLIETYYGYNGVSINYYAITITQIACGGYHSLFLTEGRVYSCGYNYSGQLGIGTSRWGSDKNTPTLIEIYYGYNDVSINYNGIRITQIACGDYHSLFLTQGSVFSCGYNLSGQLGIGTSGWGSDKNTPKLIETYYGYNDVSINYDAITITQIVGGGYHTLFLTDERNIAELDDGNEDG